MSRTRSSNGHKMTKHLWMKVIMDVAAASVITQKIDNKAKENGTKGKRHTMVSNQRRKFHGQFTV